MRESNWQLKLGRAREHQADLGRDVTGFLESGPYRVGRSREGNDVVLRVYDLREAPERISLILGDAVHNARAALDHLVLSLARRGDGSLGRKPYVDEERHLSFPVTRTARAFARRCIQLGDYLSEATLDRLRDVQPWVAVQATSMADGVLLDAAERQSLIRMHPLERLTELDNWDKHRRITTALWFPDRVAFEGSLDDLPDGTEPGWVELDLDDEEVQRMFAESAAEMARPESIDFYLGGPLLREGGEIGRFMRNDGGPIDDVPSGEARLRLVIFEHGLTELHIGAPDLLSVVEELLSTVEAVCRYVEDLSVRNRYG